jgi:hypothetical protein
MTTTIQARWIAAQVGERQFHCDYVDAWGPHADVAIRRTREAQMRHWYAGMLGIPVQVEPMHSVTDFACGPESLLLTHPQHAQMVAVDPLRFTDADEARYAAAGITRVVAPMEQYNGQTDEVWLYNCLQHVIDWDAALRVACRTARHYLRLFEWVEVPTDALHLHTLEASAMYNILCTEGFRAQQNIEGQHAMYPGSPTRFIAGVWERVQ